MIGLQNCQIELFIFFPGQFLKTNGSGTLSFGAASGGAGFSDSTITTMPGSEGNFDLSKTDNTGDSETPFSAAATDAFGVNIGSVYDMMEPTGSISTTDLGSSESHVGA